MNSTFFSVGINGEVIHGIVDMPGDAAAGANKAMIFLHGMGGYRTGPHDMFVAFARRLTGLGYHCVRFDFRGKGFSGDMERSASYASMMEDVEAIITYVREELGIHDVSITGICIGAKFALYYTRSGTYPLDKLILLSSIPLRADDKTANDAYRQAKLQLRDYAGKLWSKETWLKLFSGRIHYAKIIRKILSPFSNISSRKMMLQPERSIMYFQLLKDLNNVLVIHGGNDPETVVSLPQIERLLQKYSVPYTSRIIEGANHSFYSVKWKSQLLDMVSDWIEGKSVSV